MIAQGYTGLAHQETAPGREFHIWAPVAGRPVPIPCNFEFLPKISAAFWAKVFSGISEKELAVPLGKSWTWILPDYPGTQDSSWGKIMSHIDWWSDMWLGSGCYATKGKTKPKVQYLGQLYSPSGDDDTSRGIRTAVMVFLPSVSCSPARLPEFVCAGVCLDSLVSD